VSRTGKKQERKKDASLKAGALYKQKTAGPELRERPFEFYDAWDLTVSAAVSATTTV
jgi:hypothetical protein